MLKEWEKSEKPSEEEIKARLEAVKEKLARQQLLIKEKKVPVLVVLEGWGTMPLCPHSLRREWRRNSRKSKLCSFQDT